MNIDFIHNLDKYIKNLYYNDYNLLGNYYVVNVTGS